LVEVTDGQSAKCSEEKVPEKLEVGRSITLRNVFFETAESKLLDESVVQLTALKKIMIDYPKMEIELRGYTDDRGEKEYNLILSQSRAEAVQSWLEEEGIETSRLSSKGFGEKDAVDTNSTEAGRARNRRVEFYIVNM
jgi:outer membrane protein OmpA-like peptidoglycan-associated protein